MIRELAQLCFVEATPAGDFTVKINFLEFCPSFDLIYVREAGVGRIRRIAPV